MPHTFLPELVFATGNNGKVAGLQLILDAHNIRVLKHDADVVEPQLNSVAEIAAHKAKAAFAQIGKPLVVEDGGFYIHALGGLPGPYAKYAADVVGVENLLHMLRPERPRTCHWVSAMVFTDGTTTQTFTTDAEQGTLATDMGPEPNTIFARSGFWRVYIPNGYDKPLSAFTQAEYESWQHARRQRSTTHLFAQWYVETYLPNQQTAAA